jgi:hypothetical protein
MSSNYHAVILDARKHRIIRLGDNFSATEGYHVSVARPHVGAPDTDPDHMIVIGPDGAHRISMGGLIVPSDTTGTTLTDPSHQFAVSLDSTVHRIVPMDTELSGDPGYSVTYSTDLKAAPAGSNDQLTVTPAVGARMVIQPAGKIPPRTGA